MGFLAVLASSIVIFGVVALAIGHVHWARVHNRRAAGLVTAGGVVAFVVVGLLLPKNPATGTAASVTSNVLSSSPRAVASITTPPALSETGRDAATTRQTQPAQTPSDPSHTAGTSTLRTTPAGPVELRTSVPRPVDARATQPATQPRPPAPTNPPATAAPRSVAAAPPTQAPPPAPVNPPAAAPAAACQPLTNGGNCYEPGEYCRNADHGVHGVAGNGEAIVCTDNNGWRWEPA